MTSTIRPTLRLSFASRVQYQVTWQSHTLVMCEHLEKREILLFLPPALSVVKSHYLAVTLKDQEGQTRWRHLWDRKV